MAVKLNSEKQREAVKTVYNVNNIVVDGIAECAGILKGLEYEGEVADAIFENFANLEKSVNGNSEDFRKIEAVIDENIEISEDMRKALHQTGKVQEKSASVTINKKTADIKGLAKGAC